MVADVSCTYRPWNSGFLNYLFLMIADFRILCNGFLCLGMILPLCARSAPAIYGCFGGAAYQRPPYLSFCAVKRIPGIAAWVGLLMCRNLRRVAVVFSCYLLMGSVTSKWDVIINRRHRVFLCALFAIEQLDEIPQCLNGFLR